MTIHIRKCTLEDLEILQDVSVETFNETFKDQNSPENMKAYLDKAFNLNQLEQEISNSYSEFYFISYNGGNRRVSKGKHRRSANGIDGQ